MPTNPPLFAEVTVPFQMPVSLSNVDWDAPPITTSSRGENVKRLDLEPEDQMTSPITMVHQSEGRSKSVRRGIGKKISFVVKIQGAQNTPYDNYLPGLITNLLRGRENGFGRVTNLLLCCKKRPNSHGTRRSLSFAPCELSANSLLRLEDLTEEKCVNP
jgi:hypothetical protein